jgi:AcrR family transcriptional regulator
VCEKLNIARGTVYQYFSNKKEILFAILETVVENIEDMLDPDDLKDFLVNTPEKERSMNFIKDRLAGVMSVLVEEPIVIKLIFKEIYGIDEEVVDKVNIAVLSIAKVIGREIEELKNRGIYKNNLNPQITASMLLGGVMMLVYEFDKKKRDVLDKEVISSVAYNYLYGVMN